MATTTTKGSRKNPYTWDEYRSRLFMNNWQGGWVLSSGELSYHSCSQSIYTGTCAKSNPVPHDLYGEMQQNGIWTGGWVQVTNDTLMYYSSGGARYESTLCSASNPCTMYIYNEMIYNETWEGGWIKETNGMLRYVQSFHFNLSSGSGSGNGQSSVIGCGSGSGCGSGCGCSFGYVETLGCSISAGKCQVGSFHMNGVKIANMTVVWTQGKTFGQNDLSVVTLSVKSNNPNYNFSTNRIITLWENAYEVSIRGCLTFTHDGKSTDIPVDLSFVIPNEFRKYD